GFEWLGAGQTPTVDEDGRSTADSDAVAVPDVVLHPDGVLSGIEARVESFGVQAQAGRLSLEAGGFQFDRQGEKQVVHVPESVLIVGAERRFRHLLGAGMNIDERELAIDDADQALIERFKFVENQRRLATEW